MGTADYIVRFKGDYSALQKDINKINGETRKLADDEVIIKLNYDGNIKEFNKVFDQISKMHPELGIQFQYNVNEKILRQELDKLEKLSDLKLDIDEGKVSGKLKNLADNVEIALKDGMSKDEITKRVSEFFGYYNTAIKAGAKNIDGDFDSINNRLYDLFKNQAEDIKDIYDEIFYSNDNKKIELFKIDGSLNNDLIKTKERVDDLQSTLKGLEEKGASKSGLPSELQRVQDEIKILRADIDSMKGELKNLSGDAFNDMTEQIKGTNEQLNYTLQTLTNLKRALASNDIKIKNSIGGVIRQWQSEEETKSYERYTAFNSQTRETSGAHLAADATGVSMKLMKAAIAELGDNAEGTIHSHPMKNAAFSDDDIERYISLFEESQGKIFLNSITSAEQAMTIDMRKVDISKKDEIVQTIKDSYKAIDDKYLGNLQLSVNEIKEDIMPLLNLKADNPIIGSVIKTIRENFDDLFDGIMNLNEFSDVFEENADYILKQIPELKQLSKEDRNNIMMGVGGYIDLLHDSILGTVSENAQKEYQRVLQEVFAKPEFLKSGETSAIKIEALTDFIDWGSIEDAATEATKEAADAIKKAQDSNSPAELTKPLGQNFTEGYAEGIREAIPEVVKACKEVVLAAYNAIKEAKTSEDGESVDFSEGFINSFKESLDKAVPTIQEKIKEVFSKINIGDENSSMFEGIGQEIIDSIIVGLKNAHSGESFTASLESIINNAFTQVALDSAVRDFLVQLQTTMDTQGDLRLKYFSVDTDSIAFQIQNGLDNNTFNINLGGTIQNLATALNTSADNVRSTFLDAVRWMREADKWQNEQGSVGARERKLYYNTKTGEFSNPSIIGGDHSTPAFLDMVADYKSKGTIFDTSLHTHLYDDYAFPSSLGNAAGGGSGDIDIWFKNAYSSLYGGIYETISKFVVGAQKEYVEFDFSKIASNAEELENFLVNWIKENFEKVEEVLGEDALDYELNPRKVAGLYVGKKLIKLAHEKESDSSFTPYNDVEELFESMFRQYEDKGWLESQVTGELSTFREIFDERAPLKFGPGINLFDSMPDLLNEALDKIVTKIRTWITQAADFGENIGMTTIKDAIDNALSTTLVDDKFSEIRDFQEIIKRGFTSYFKDEFTQGRFSIDGIQSWDEAGSVALHELIDTDDLIGKIVRYYTPDEFEKNFGAKLPSNFRPIKQYNTRDFMKWGVDDQGNHLRNGLSFDNLDSDEIIEWKKRLLQYFPELIESQAEELYNFMKSDYGNDFGFDEHFIAKINGYVAQNARQQQSDISQTQLPFSPILPEDFQTQLQNAIEESGKYLIKVYGELIDGFKSQLQQDIDEIGYLFVELKGRLSDDFKEALQSAIDSLGAIPIEVKPYVRKGSEIEEVDLPGGNQNNLSSDTTILPSQINEIAQAEDRMGNEAQEATEQARQGLAEMREEAEKTIEVFRGLDVVGSNGISENGVTFTSSSPNVAALYQLTRDRSGLGGKYFSQGEILKETIDTSKMFSIDAEGKYFDSIQYWGDQTTEEGKKIKNTYEDLIQKLKEYIPLVKEAFGDDIRYRSILDYIDLDNLNADGLDSIYDLMEHLSFDKDNLFTPKPIVEGFSSVFESYQQLKQYIDANPLVGIWYTDDFVAEVQKMGYSVLEIKNVIDAFNGIKQDLANDYVIINPDAIVNVEKYTDELSELTKVRLKYAAVTRYSNQDTDELLKNDFADSDNRYVPEIFDYAVSKYGKDNYQDIFKVIFSEDVEAKRQLAEEIIKYRQEGIQALNKALQSPNETPISTSSTEAETKALLSKKEVVEQLRAELNLTKKAAEDIFNEQGYSKTNGKYQIEQQAIDELIASLKEKQQLEGNSTSTTPTTSSVADNIQSEVDAVTKAIDAEKKKFDELKNKISKTIPNAIETKNKAFKEEADLVSSLVGGESKEFDNLKNSIDGVTDATKNQAQNVSGDTSQSKTKNSSKDAYKQVKKDSLQTRVDAEKQRQAAINNLLTQRKNTYQKILDINKLIAKLDSENNAEQIKELLTQKRIAQQDYLKQTKDLKNLGAANKASAQSATFSPLGKKNSEDIAVIQAKKIDDAYSTAENKANVLLGKISKLRESGKYTQEFINELNVAENELRNFLSQLSNKTMPFDQIKGKINELSDNIENTLAKKAFNNVKLAAEKSLTNVGLKIDQIIAKNSAMGKEFETRFKALKNALKDAQSIDAVQKIVSEVNRLESELISAGKTGRSFFDQIKQRLKDINSKYIAQYFSFQDIIRYARQAATNIIQLNDAFIELSKVSDTSLTNLESDFQSYANIAKDIGGTITDTINATADWARMGYSVPDSKELARVAMLYKNVGDGIDISQANESLISTLQGYQMQADEAEHIVDVFNEVANNYAIDTGGIGEALQRSAASLNAANTSLEESVALVTAANTVVQNPESVGTTFKTLSARIRGASTELEELGEEGDEFTETTSKLQGLIKGLTGFDILESDQKTFKSIYDILIGIGKEWKNLTDIERASLGEALAGKRNANTLYAVLDNIETLESAYQTAEESAGSAQREQENYQKGITYSINQAKAALEELSYDAINSDFLKGLVDTGTDALEIIDKIIDKFGVFKTLAIGVATVIGSQKLGYCN